MTDELSQTQLNDIERIIRIAIANRHTVVLDCESARLLLEMAHRPTADETERDAATLRQRLEFAGGVKAEVT